ncbi:secreted ribonuclease T2 [Phycomyces blakesleeanus]|uniref:ribonuclease T2 n=2 Tax=Phycomyces blakesleeanus TaxID=4837 RepID=A0A167KGW5_PHYB8|nr:secreted ribonuclease T2 [Phycomyces blakesleeanus NRRL 1555(-)]OAD68066.1 secreted ribonuclease T2 [Phycomyces blakesleeanus NRRL 1555(-)]|eukprot:XP_018286106.1 secreted ribonuclease T2 [Phycomyces blakesleeanus NRRL 1555(-)]
MLRSILGLILTSALTATAFQASQQVFQEEDYFEQNLYEAPSCNNTLLSCHWNGRVDSCCTPKYGLVVLTLQWVPGFGPDKEFTIHGLWPDTCSGGRAPGNGCDRSRVANNIGNIVRDMDPSLHSEMSTFWPSYKGDNNWFWSHEWNKHGTCISTLRPSCYGKEYTKYQDVTAYFKQALELRHYYDLFGALNLAGVIPGQTYNVQTMIEPLEKYVGAKIKMDCDRKGQLSEVSMFFYVEGRDKYKITDAFQKGNCRGAVWYPKKY